MPKKSAELKAEIKDIRAKYDQMFAKGDVTESEAEELRAMDAKLEELIAEYSARSQDEQRADSNREAMKHLFGGDRASEPTGDGERKPEPPQARSVGEKVVNDPQFRAWHASLTGGGQHRISENVGVKSPMVELPMGFRESAALVTGLSSTSAGALVVEERLGGITPLERDEIAILDLITRIPIDTDAFEYVRVTTETNNAAPVLEATNVSSGAKPESAVAMEIVSGIIETIAHWIPITRRAASDARQIMAYIDEFLRYGLRDELASQVLTGNGTTPNLVGLASVSGTQDQAFDTDILTTTRKARTLVRTVGKLSPTAYLMDPADWQTIDLLQDNENRYYFGGPQRLGVPVLWGLPVVEEDKLTAGTAWVGAWREFLLFDRQQTAVYMTDSHSDFFIRNILVILAELRAGAGVRRPKAFVEIDLTA
jgi:HK97 family phage major capsid protein